MATSPQDRIARLEAEESELVLPRFDQALAWRLGRALAERALTDDLGVAIDIRRAGGQVLFHAALPGSLPDQEHWIAGKAAVVLRMESSSALVAARFEAAGAGASGGWLTRPEYAVTGGSVPVRVRGVGVVAAVTVSGLSSEDDHDLVVAAIRELIAEIEEADPRG